MLSSNKGIDKLTEKSLIYLRFVSAHKNQLIDFYRYLFFKTEQKIKNSLTFWLTCQYPKFIYAIQAQNVSIRSMYQKAAIVPPLYAQIRLNELTKLKRKKSCFSSKNRTIPATNITAKMKIQLSNLYPDVKRTEVL